MKLETLSKKLYPNTNDRKNAEQAIEMIVTTERFINAEKDYDDIRKEIRSYLYEQNGNFPGHFLIILDKIKRANLRELINFTFKTHLIEEQK